MTVKERLIEFIKNKDMSVRAFCRIIGVSETYVSSMRSSIQPDKLIKIAYRFPELNTKWLLTGEGEMISHDEMMPPISRTDLANAGYDTFKDKLIELFTKGEIYSAAVVKEKDEVIRNLFNRIMVLEKENGELLAEIKMLKGEQHD